MQTDIPNVQDGTPVNSQAKKAVSQYTAIKIIELRAESLDQSPLRSVIIGNIVASFGLELHRHSVKM